MEQAAYTSAVIKVGTNTCTKKNGRLHKKVIHSLTDQTMTVNDHIKNVFLVTSGAVAAGRKAYGVVKTPDEDADTKGMYSSCGQPILMNKYRRRLKNKHDCRAHQILVTKENFSGERSKTLLGRLRKISESNARGLPIFNENDAIADDEIGNKEKKFTDNDELAGLLAGLVHADVVVLLTNVVGVMEDKDDDSTLIPEITPETQAENRRFVVAGASKDGSGGMDSKYDTACRLANMGITVYIANGREKDVLTRILINRKRIGTVFTPKLADV